MDLRRNIFGNGLVTLALLFLCMKSITTAGELKRIDWISGGIFLGLGWPV